MSYTITTEQLTKQLKELTIREEPSIIILSGDWGVGKTTYWKDFKREHLFIAEKELKKKKITFNPKKWLCGMSPIN